MKSILLVEPNDEMRQALEGALGDAGFQVGCVRSGRDAVDWSKASPETLHLLITEVELPDFSGIFLAEYLTEIWPDLLVLLTAWQPRDRLRADGHVLGDLPFLEKPLRLRRVREEVEHLLS